MAQMIRFLLFAPYIGWFYGPFSFWVNSQQIERTDRIAMAETVRRRVLYKKLDGDGNLNLDGKVDGNG